MGAAASTGSTGVSHLIEQMERLGTSSADGMAKELFAELDTAQTGFLSVDDLTGLAVDYFATQQTIQPAVWIRTQIQKHDVDGDGWLNEVEFTHAVDALRRS